MRGMGGVTLWVSGAVFLVSAVVFGATVVDALRVDEARVAAAALPGEGVGGPASAPSAWIDDPSAPGSQAAGAASPAGQEPFRGIVYPRVTTDEILDAVNLDPFQPSRTPSPQRYLLPSERSPTAASSRTDSRRRGPELRLVGSAVGGDLSLAMIQVDHDAPVAFLLGEVVEGYRLAAVEAESAILEGEIETLTLPLMAQLEPQRGRASTQRGSAASGAQGAQVNPRDVEALQNRVQELLQGMGRGGGMGPGGGMGARLQEIMELGPNVIIRGGERVIQLPPGVVRSGRTSGGGGLQP